MAETPIERIASALAKAIAQGVSDAKGDLDDIAKDGGHAAAGGFLGDVGRLTDLISSVLSDIPVLVDLLAPELAPIVAVENSAGKLGRGIGHGYLIGYFLWQMFQPVLLPLQHLINAHTTNELFDPQTAAELVAKGILDQQAGEDESSGNGLDVPHFDKLVDAARVRPALTELIELYRRGQIDQTEAFLALEREGVPESWRPLLLGLSRQLLPGAELALATLRGNLDLDYAKQYAASLGILEADFQTLVDNTGEPPGLMQLLEAYRRGYVEKDRLERGIRQSRVRDEWIDVVEALRFEPLSAADAVNAAVQGHLSYDAAKSKATESGLNPDDFDTAYQNAGEPIGLVEMLQLWNRGVMTESEVVQGIKESHYKDKYIPFILHRRRQLIPYRTINTILKAGVKDRAWGISYLMDLGYTQEDAAALVDTSTTGKTLKHKDATEAQILALYHGKAIDEAKAVELLAGIGYDQTEADLILKVEAASRAYAEQQRAVTALRSAFLGTKITAEDAAREMDRLGVAHAERDKLLADWKVERGGIVKTLTAAQVASAVYYGIWSYDEAVAKLRELGYSANDAAVVVDLRVHGVPPGVQPPGPPTRIGA